MQNSQRQNPGSAGGRDSVECDAGLKPEDSDSDSDSESIRVNIGERHSDGNTKTDQCDRLIYKECVKHVMHCSNALLDVARGAASGDALVNALHDY
jgi:hypothetical protein